MLKLRGWFKDHALLKLILGIVFIMICALLVLGVFSGNAHADYNQEYRQGQQMQRLVKAEEDQVKALQNIVEVLKLIQRKMD